MSFELVTSYQRPILRSLVLPAHDQSQSIRLPPISSFTSSHAWISSTHVFSGTGDRDESGAWPAAKFKDDPADIPDDNGHNVPYNAASAKASDGHKFTLYNDHSKFTNVSSVSPPLLVAKRYAPTKKATTGIQGITLLVLAGMGAPKEVSIASHCEIRIHGG